MRHRARIKTHHFAVDGECRLAPIKDVVGFRQHARVATLSALKANIEAIEPLRLLTWSSSLDPWHRSDHEFSG